MTNEASMLARSLAAEAFRVAPDVVPSDAAIGEIDAWDSLAHLRLIMALEAKLGRELTTEEAAGIVNLGDVARVIAAAAP